MSRHIEIALVGPGAIGTTIAAILHEAGRTPLVCGRTPRDQLALFDRDRRIIVPGRVRTDPAEITRPADLVFLAVKATQVAGAAKWLAALSSPRTVVCVLQNGVEQVQSVTPHLPQGEIVPAVVWFPSQAQADGSVRLLGDVRLSLPDLPAARLVTEAFMETRCSVELAPDFNSVAWRKLLQNAVAGLMALTGRRSGMFARDDIGGLTLAYLRECLAVARAEGAVLTDTVPQEILEKFRASPAGMGTSILADREAHRPLEWDVRNGVIARRGRAHGIATPISDILVPLLAATSDGPG